MPEPTMENRQRWRECINKLRSRHGGSAEALARKANYVVKRAYVQLFLHGEIPRYETAIAFLEHFPREEALECLEAAGYSPPLDWHIPTVEEVKQTLTKLSDEEVREVIRFAAELGEEGED